jgi:ABC-type nitrate/sulfonate/bicarbonate transport system ATPase subunit
VTSAQQRWLVRISDVSFTYPNGVQALSGVSLELAEGEVVSVIGPSGCGKSTLVSVLSGLRESTGSVVWNRDVLRELDGSGRRPFSVVFQRNTVMPWLNVEKNIAFGLRYLKLSRQDIRQRVNSLLETGGLVDFRRAYPHELSGGMERRVALLTGVATLPKLLILDEPFSALDEPTRVSLHRELLVLLREYGMSALLITHDLGEAVSLSNRVCVFSNRPARLSSVVDIKLPPDRDVEKIRATDEYQDGYRELWESLWQQINARV